MPAQSKKMRRKGTPMRRVSLTLPVPTFDKLSKMAGPMAYNQMVEELTEREWKRRVKRQESASIPQSSLISQ